MFDQPEHVPTDEIIRDINRIFELVDFTEWLQFVGGEIFMRHDLWEVYRHCLNNRKSKFDKLILITNATLLPCDKDIEVMREYGGNAQVQISDYGEHSYKTKELSALLSENNIPFVIKRYHGDLQHYGGWIDNTHFTDRGKNDEALREQFEHCGQVAMRNFHLYRGVFHGCARSLTASALGKIVPARRDYVDLNDAGMSNEEKREIIRHFNDSPRVSCRSCVSFNEDVERYKAAEQIAAPD
jgi:hypothetical protein